jgi:hypothetical protein
LNRIERVVLRTGLAGLLVTALALAASNTLVHPGGKPQYCGHDEQMDRFMRQEAAPSRPELSGNELTKTSTHFRVHYTLSGEDSCTAAHADTVKVAAETSWARASALGWQMPPSDGGRGGGSGLYDIYIRKLVGYSGVCIEDSEYTETYPDGYTSWVEVENDFSSWPYVRSLVAHEFSHSNQKAYSQFENDPARYFYENTSTLMQHIIFSDVDQLPDWLGSSPSHLKTPHWGIFTRSGTYHYSGALWAWMLSNYYDDVMPRALIRSWTIMGGHAGEHTRYDTDSVLRRYYDSDLKKAIGHYAVWRFFTAGRDDGRHFDDGETYPLVTILRSHSSYPASGDEGSTPPSVPGGCNFIRLTGFGTNDVTVSFDGQNGYNWACYLVGLRGGSSYEYKLVLNANEAGSITIPGAEFDTIAIIPVEIYWADTAAGRTYTYNVSLSYYASAGVAERPLPVDFAIRTSTNPVRAPVTFNLPRAADAVFRIRSLTGACVRVYDRPSADLIWDGRDGRGKQVPSGTYICELEAGDHVARKKLVLSSRAPGNGWLGR